MGASASSTAAVAKPEPEPEAKKQPLVDPPSEKTPLTAGSSKSGEKPPPPLYATAASLVLLVGIAVLKTQITAQLFSYSNIPTAYSLYSCIVTDILLVPFFLVKPSMWAVPTRSMAGVLSLIVFFTALDLAFTNIALANISSALQQSIASTNAFWAITIETMLYCKFQHPMVYFAVTFIVVGAVLTGGGENDPSVYGVTAAVVAVLSSASKYVFTHKAFQAFKGELGSLALLFWVDLFLIPIYLVWTLINGELVTGYESATADAQTFWLLTGTAALGGVRALSQYLVLVFLTATSMSTANIFTQILNILISITITQSHRVTVNSQLIAGVVLVFVFSFFYLFIKAYKPFLENVDGFCGGLFGLKSEAKAPAEAV